MKDFHHQLQRIVNNTDANEAYKAVAKALIENMSELDKMPIEKLAQLSFTSLSTISRFVKTLGYPNFAALKSDAKTYRTSRMIEMNDNIADLKFNGQQDLAITNRYFSEIGRAIAALGEQIDFAKIDAVNEKIYSAKMLNIYAVLFPGSIASFYQRSMLYIGKYCEFYDITDCAVTNPGNPADLALFFSVDGNCIEANKKFIVELKKQGTQLILVTQNPRINIINAFDDVLYMGACDSPKSGRYKLVAFAELLLTRYYQKYYADEML